MKLTIIVVWAPKRWTERLGACQPLPLWLQGASVPSTQWGGLLTTRYPQYRQMHIFISVIDQIYLEIETVLATYSFKSR